MTAPPPPPVGLLSAQAMTAAPAAVTANAAPASQATVSKAANATQATTTNAANASQATTTLAGTAAQGTTTTAGLQTNPDGTPFDFNTAAGTMQSATTYTPSQDSLVSAQLTKLIAADSPYMQLARTRAMQQSASRGLLNSSMAAGAGEAAAIEAGRPIAEGDASAYFTAQRDNAGAQNTFSRDANAFGREGALSVFREGSATNRFNAGEANTTSRFNAGETNTTSRFNADSKNANSRFNAGETNTTNRFNADSANTNSRFNAGETNTTSRFNTDQANTTSRFNTGEDNTTERFNADAANDTRRFNTDQANTNRRFNASEENDMRSQTNAASIQLQQMGFANDLNNANVPANFALQTSQTLMTGVNAIMADPTLKPDAKRVAVQNLTTYANSQMTWASGFFGTPMRSFAVPA